MLKASTPTTVQLHDVIIEIFSLSSSSFQVALVAVQNPSEPLVLRVPEGESLSFAYSVLSKSSIHLFFSFRLT